MNFVGFDFQAHTLPFGLTYVPEGWNENLAFRVTRSAASVRDWQTDDGYQKRLRPIALESTGLPTSLESTQVIDSLVAEANSGESAGPLGAVDRATEIPSVLSKRANVLSYASMTDALCAGFMIATFKYEFADAPEMQQPGQNEMKGSKRRVAQDAVVATAFNLAKKKTGNNLKLTVLHSSAHNLDQVHTEQLLCGQLDAFMTMLNDPASRPTVVNVLERWKFKGEPFDMKKLTVVVKIVFEHRMKNVTADCDACSRTIEKVTGRWSGKCKGFAITVSKNS